MIIISILPNPISERNLKEKCNYKDRRLSVIANIVFVETSIIGNDNYRVHVTISFVTRKKIAISKMTNMISNVEHFPRTVYYGANIVIITWRTRAAECRKVGKKTCLVNKREGDNAACKMQPLRTLHQSRMPCAETARPVRPTTCGRPGKSQSWGKWRVASVAWQSQQRRDVDGRISVAVKLSCYIVLSIGIQHSRRERDLIYLYLIELTH